MDNPIGSVDILDFRASPIGSKGAETLPDRVSNIIDGLNGRVGEDVDLSEAKATSIEWGALQSGVGDSILVVVIQTGEVEDDGAETSLALMVLSRELDVRNDIDS